MSDGYNIQFYSSTAYESWNWANPDTVGIGGSESAVVFMAEGLAARGHAVTVYAPIPADTPTPHKGVHWHHVDQADFTRPGLWIVSRCPEIADRFPLDHRQRGQVLWHVCQDEDYPSWATWPDRRLQFDRILALCQAQAKQFKSRYPDEAGRIHVSSNGIRRELVESVLAEGLERDPCRIVYASSPDRGLEPLLHIHQRYREYEPSATLHVCYGFDNIDKSMAQFEAAEAKGELAAKGRASLRRIKELKEKLATFPGVVHHGRLPQRELYREIARSAFWVYATAFRETNCAVGSTKVCTVDSGAATLEWLARNRKDAAFAVWSCDRNGKLAVSAARNCRKTRENAEVVKVVVRSADHCRELLVTPDHKVMLAEPNELISKQAKDDALQSMEAFRRSNQWQGGMIEAIPPMEFVPSPIAPVETTPYPHVYKIGEPYSYHAQPKQMYCPAGQLQVGDRVMLANDGDYQRPTGFHSGVVLSVEPAGREDVYCMEVLPDRNFIANGVVIHNCISSMEAQALGAFPIVSPVWAVGENVRYGVHWEGDPNDWNTQARFAGELYRTGLSQECMAQVRAEMMPWALESFEYGRWLGQWEGWMREDLGVTH